MTPKQLKEIEERLRKVQGALHGVAAPIERIQSARRIMIAAMDAIGAYVETDINGNIKPACREIASAGDMMAQWLNSTDKFEDGPGPD